MKDLTFRDLVVLEMIEKNTVIDSFGSKINSSFFDTAELMGTLQVKGLIEIKPTIGRSIANRTKLGEEILKKAEAKAEEPLDELDHAILKTIASGARKFEDIMREINIRSEDLSYHLYKLVKKGYADYNMRNVQLTISLTENGFKLTGFVPKKHKPMVKHEERLEKAAMTVERESEIPEVEREMVSGEDITSRIPGGEKVKLTRGYRLKVKTAYYLRKYGPIIAVSVVILLVLAAKLMNLI